MQIKSQHQPEDLKGSVPQAFPTSESLTCPLGSFVQWELSHVSKMVSCALVLSSGSPQYFLSWL